MTESEQSRILAIVTMNAGSVSGGGAPVFLGRDEHECERMANSLSRILDSMVHYLENGTYIIVSH